jgi:hypothetical protein
MASASWALQQSIFAALTGDAALANLLGGPRVYDDVSVRAEFPFMTFAQSNERDWSTGTEAGEEHFLTLHIWSRAHGRKETQEIIGAVREVLHDQSLSLSGYRLVNLRHEFSDARREADGETYHGIVRYRAVTEPLP